MKARATRFESLEAGLKELEPFIRNGHHLETGGQIKGFDGLRSRELLANWLLCVALNSVTHANRWTFYSDPEGSDGIIYDTIRNEGVQTEHVLVPTKRGACSDNEPLEARILKAIEHKQRRGPTYASGKMLVVFVHTGEIVENWSPKEVATKLPAIDFNALWVMSLQPIEAGEYIYNVVQLDLDQRNPLMWRVYIGKDFDRWEVELVQ